MNLGNIVKTKFLKNFPKTVLAIISGLSIIVAISALTGYFTTLFQ